MGADPPGFPVLFLKGPNTLNRPEGAIHAPAFVTQLDYEGELGVVIRQRAKDIKAKDFTDYVLGYTCLIDATARDVQRHDGQWTRGKSMDGFCPVGPFVVDDVDPASLKVETRLNGKVVQQGNTADFITPVGRLIEFITASMTLEPGDVVATGTPAGVGPMIPGDVVEVRDSSRQSPIFKRLTGEDAPMILVPQWLEKEKSEPLKGKVSRLPVREDINDMPIEEHLIVELYSK